MSHTARPIRTVPFFTPGTFALLGLVAFGAYFWVQRFVLGLAAVTNLNDQYPWGIWIAFDVACGVALAAGGFTTAALCHIFGRKRYHSLVRPALLTALLGYTFVAVGLLFDLGRYYNIWRPVFFWQGNSVLFEVGICVICYLTVLFIEFLPILLERFRDLLPRPLRFLNPLLNLSERVLERMLSIFIPLGVVLSCLHQSSLGTLMLIAPTKMHPLYFTPILPLLFLLSAIAVGFPMVILESLSAARSLRLEPELALLGRLSRVTPVLLFLVLSLRLGDLAVRGVLPALLDGSAAAIITWIELALGMLAPLLLLLSRRVRASRAGLLVASVLVISGVCLNRIAVFLVAYNPPFAERAYWPAVGEIATSLSLVALLILCYRAAVQLLPVIAGPEQAEKTS